MERAILGSSSESSVICRAHETGFTMRLWHLQPFPRRISSLRGVSSNEGRISHAAHWCGAIACFFRERRRWAKDRFSATHCWKQRNGLCETSIHVTSSSRTVSNPPAAPSQFIWAPWLVFLIQHLGHPRSLTQAIPHQLPRLFRLTTLATPHRLARSHPSISWPFLPITPAMPHPRPRQPPFTL